MARVVPLANQRGVDDLKKNSITPYFMIFPVIALILLFKIYPIASSVIESMFRVGAGQVSYFIGLQNFVDLTKDTIFLGSFLTTIKFNLILTPLQVVLSTLLAVLVNQPIRGIRVFRTIYYSPMGVSIAVSSILWGMMLSINGGLINSCLSLLGLPQQPFLSSPIQALYSIVLTSTWKGVGYWMIFILAGLQGIPNDLYESATIDGSNPIHTFFYITIPMLRSTLTFVIVTDTVTNLLLFAPMYMLTDGGPQRSTNTLMLEAYKTLYRSTDPGRAYAIITVLIIMVSLVVIIQKLLLRERISVKKRWVA